MKADRNSSVCFDKSELGWLACLCFLKLYDGAGDNFLPVDFHVNK